MILFLHWVFQVFNIVAKKKNDLDNELDFITKRHEQLYQFTVTVFYSCTCICKCTIVYSLPICQNEIISQWKRQWKQS